MFKVEVTLLFATDQALLPSSSEPLNRGFITMSNFNRKRALLLVLSSLITLYINYQTFGLNKPSVLIRDGINIVVAIITRIEAENNSSNDSEE